MIQHCFLAIPLDEANVSKFAALVAELKTLGLNVRFQRAESAHVTLVYFGTIRETKLDKMIETIEEITSSAKGFEINIQDVGTFGTERHPRVVWLGPTPNVALTELQTKLQTAFQTTFTVRDKRPFHAHLTVARIESAGKYLSRQPEFEAKLATQQFTLSVDRLRLYASDQANGEFQTPICDFLFPES